MTEFWVYSALMIALAAAFVVMPLIRKTATTDVASIDELAERKRQNVQIFKERLAELERDQELGVIDQEQFEALQNELEKSLLSDVEVTPALVPAGSVESADSSSEPSKGLRLGFGVALAAVLIATSYALYFKWGAYERQSQYLSMSFGADEIESAKQAARNGDMGALITQLHNKLQGAPDNIEGWMLLARTAMNVERYPLAIESFQTVIGSIERAGQSAASVYGLLAQAHYFNAGGTMTQSAQQAIDTALAQNPDETNAIGLLAIYAFDQGRYKEAVEDWERLLKVAPDHPARASIEAGIKRARALSGEPMVAQSQPDSAEPASVNANGASVRVKVSLSAQFSAQVSPNDSLFIFARSPNGPPMPLAASRHTVSELPIEIELNDSMAMAPMAKLSNVSHANIVARISKSGQPIAQPGDLFGILEDVPVNEDASIEITIDQIK